jgi:hypothetical protein
MAHAGRRRGVAPSTPAPSARSDLQKGMTPLFYLCSTSKANPPHSGLDRLCYKNGPFVSSGRIAPQKRF